VVRDWNRYQDRLIILPECDGLGAGGGPAEVFAGELKCSSLIIRGGEWVFEFHRRFIGTASGRLIKGV